MEEATTRALERNLELVVERLNPQTFDLTIARLRAAYHPIATSQFNQRAVVLPPTNQLNGGNIVQNDTTDYNAGVSQALPWGGGAVAFQFNNRKQVTSNIFANFNPTFTSNFNLLLTQPLLRGLLVDNNRQQLRVTTINREISEIQLRGTVATTVAAVRNAYWELLFALDAVEVARGSLALAEKLVEDNQVRVEIGTMAPLDVVQAAAEAATRRQAVAQAEATWRTAELALKRLIVSGTDDPLWRASLRPSDSPEYAPEPLDVETAVRRALESRTDLQQARRQIEGNNLTLRFTRNEMLPDLELAASYGAQGLGGTQFIRQGSGLGSSVIGNIPGGRQLSGLPGAVIRANAAGGNFQLNRLLSGGEGDARLALEIRGDDLDDARRIAADTRAFMADTPGIADVRLARDEGRPEIAVRIDRPKAATLGMTPQYVTSTIQTNVAGTQAALFRERGSEYPVVVRLREADRSVIADIGNVLVSTPTGQVVPARNLLAIGRETGPVQIDRKNMERITRVNADLETSLSDAVRAVEERLDQVRVPPDFAVGFGAEVEEQARSFRQLQLVLVLALLLVYAVMASQYESLRDPFIIMFSIPVAGIGVVGSLFLTETAFNMQAFIGVIMLGGIVVSNAILLVDYTNTLRRRDGMALREAVELAGRRRLRPILMTSLATMLGLVPMATGLGEGGELQAPLARVVIGGLLASTMVTLVLVPAVYTLFEEGWKGLRRGARA